MFSLKQKETHFVYFAAIGLSLFWYVSHTSQIAALGYVSDTNYIVAFWYLAPITAFGNSFLVHDVMESGGRAQIITLPRNIGLI